MKRILVRQFFLGLLIAGVLSATACKNNDTNARSSHNPEAMQEGTEATDAAADTTSRVEEDSIMDTPTP